MGNRFVRSIVSLAPTNKRVELSEGKAEPATFGRLEGSVRVRAADAHRTAAGRATSETSMFHEHHLERKGREREGGERNFARHSSMSQLIDTFGCSSRGPHDDRQRKSQYIYGHYYSLIHDRFSPLHYAKNG